MTCCMGEGDATCVDNYTILTTIYSPFIDNTL